ncbi:MAG: O-antigen ligase family protein [Hyphomicrobiaceae bacterium]
MGNVASLRHAHDTAAPAHGFLVSVASLGRVGVFMAIAASGIVFSEPAPVDVLMLGLVLLLPLVGLQRYAPGMLLQLLLWLGCGIGALIASGMSREIGDSARHTAVSFYLYAAFLVLAAFVALRPAAHTRLIFGAWVLAALVAAAAALIGYFSLAPGAFDLFTLYGRAAGTFKDPNVLGPFLVPAILYLGHRLIYRESRWPAACLAGLGLLVGAVLLSFSRGAWFNLAVAILLYGALTLVIVGTPEARTRLVLLAAIGIALAVAAFVAALQIDQVAKLLAERSSLTQGYDVGPQGRFGGQAKAVALILDNPFGLGAKQFSEHYHHEDVHNVYLSMFLNAGWLGGLLYIAAVVSTVGIAFRHVLRGTPTRPLFLIVLSALLGNVLEGFVIDTDHWRHFYILLALAWGLMGAANPSAGLTRLSRERGGLSEHH